MWRNYAGTFTPKRASQRKPSSFSHSDNLLEVKEDGVLSSSSATKEKHYRRRRSSSISSLGDLIDSPTASHFPSDLDQLVGRLPSGLVNNTPYSSSSPVLVSQSVPSPLPTFSSATTTREASACSNTRPPTTISFVRKHKGSLPPTTEPLRINSSKVGVVLPGFASQAKRDSLLQVEEGSGAPDKLKTPPPFKLPPPLKPTEMTQASGISSVAPTSMFEPSSCSDRPAPEMPTTEGIEYPRAASWSSSTVAEILRDPIGRQVFRCFLFEALAEENLIFVEAIEKLKKEKNPEKIKLGIIELLGQYGSYINLSSVAMNKLRKASESDTPDPKSLELAHKEISKLLENDQFPRFRRSTIYLNFLEKLLPRSYAEKWSTSFDALLGNQVGRHHFRQYLFSVHAEENLRFWESVVEFRQIKNKSTAMLNMGRNIQQQFLREGANNEVFLPFGLRQRVEKKIKEKDVDETLFDDAVKHVEQILKNDPYVRFLQSKDYKELLTKLG